ncbi:MAG TPA: T9SS type A sorting domain-containing protein [Rhodothermales bacterium]|nr:T9SS type A sorting domain-containing protein [Rhodothermales bacterium]
MGRTLYPCRRGDRQDQGSPFPNPTSGLSIVGVTLARDEPVSVRLYDLSGRLVRDYTTGMLPPGRRNVTIDGAGLSGGRYLYRISTSSTEQTGVILLTP